MSTYVHEQRKVVDGVRSLLETNKGSIGLQFVGSYDERKLPDYPAVVVSPAGKAKEIRGLQKFLVSFIVDIWVYHALMTITRTDRTEEDLILCEKIERVLETDMTLGGLVVHGFIAEETPGIIQPQTSKSDIVIGTMMQWMAQSSRGFEY